MLNKILEFQQQIAKQEAELKEARIIDALNISLRKKGYAFNSKQELLIFVNTNVTRASQSTAISYQEAYSFEGKVLFYYAEEIQMSDVLSSFRAETTCKIWAPNETD